MKHIYTRDMQKGINFNAEPELPEQEPEQPESEQERKQEPEQSESEQERKQEPEQQPGQQEIKNSKYPPILQSIHAVSCVYAFSLLRYRIKEREVLA